MLIRMLARLAVVVLSLMILFVSVARAGLTLMAQDGGMEVLKSEEIKFLKIFGDGETLAGTYKLPEPGMLPSNILYGFKQLRDYLWIVLSKGNDKVKLVTLMADKKVAEFADLTANGQRDMAIESGNGAIDKLEYASKLAGEINGVDAQSKQIKTQILWAGLAYGEVFRRSEQDYQIDSEKYTKLLTRIDDWNKEQEKNRFNWNY